MEELYKAIEYIGEIAEQVGMTAQEFNDYLKQFASTPIMKFEYDKDQIWTFSIPEQSETKKEEWSWLDKDDINE